jgi:2-methylcitrate dehydratase PrpD
MEARQEQQSAVEAPTRALAAFAASLRYKDLPAPALAVAKHCILDWLGVTLAGSHDPLVGMLVEEVEDQGGNAQAGIIGWDRRASMSQAALVNGAAGHALDFDDVLRAFMGHPTAPVLPALLALAERRGATGRDIIQAFAAGVETEARIGRMMTESHYARGFHSTATLGTIGAAVACGRLLGFDADRMATAMGIAATQSAGLKSMFGTMCTPPASRRAASPAAPTCWSVSRASPTPSRTGSTPPPASKVSARPGTCRMCSSSTTLPATAPTRRSRRPARSRPTRPSTPPRSRRSRSASTIAA